MRWASEKGGRDVSEESPDGPVLPPDLVADVPGPVRLIEFNNLGDRDGRFVRHAGPDRFIPAAEFEMGRKGWSQL